MKRNLFILTAVIVASGCQSVSTPMRIGVDSYEVSSEMAGMFPSWAEVKNLALQRANEHCDQLGKTMTLEKEDFSGARGWTPIEAHIKFKCVDTPK